ncbi:5'-3' exonuclease [Engelhardtia mirabilis]|uniref:DNA polymerase I n=1 Tax=Engelhardtia mirabilis TaxID=2528011 RepID=A0A518BMW2_9BACT|nr:DNA polymerase I [Planctomycetes bacterium Pla133]QDV02647.1 DNA polymerase I [Planctomycetes bacterium Pla86]
MRTVHLIDSLPYVFRAYYSIPASMTDPEGRPVNAVYGFCGMLLRYLAEEQPTHIALTFDESLDTSFRNDAYPAYKSSREPAPPELVHQIQACVDLGRALGMPTYADDRYEADDLIGTLAAKFTKGGHRCVVVTNDKDLGQLVNDQVEFYDFAKGDRRDAAGVRAKLGVWPHQVPDFLGLAGDAVDDIPGVAGVGAKTAVALLEAFDDLDAIYADLGAVAAMSIRGAKSVAAKLEAGRELAFLSRDLATIARDAPVAAGLRELAYRGADAALIDPLFERLGFGRVRDRIGRWQP